MAIVPPYTTGIVQADLQCAGMFVAELGTGATLDLNGHTIVGGVGSLAATNSKWWDRVPSSAPSR
jgi:hypothetical protein